MERGENRGSRNESRKQRDGVERGEDNEGGQEADSVS